MSYNTHIKITMPAIDQALVGGSLASTWLLNRTFMVAFNSSGLSLRGCTDKSPLTST